jgi:hypothetical protein
MTIKAGDTMPTGVLTHMTKDGPQKITTNQLFRRQEGRIVLGTRRIHADL